MKKAKFKWTLNYTFATLSVTLLFFLSVLAANEPGLSFDQGTFMAWTLRFREVSLASFYQKDYFCDYLPGYLFVLKLLSYPGGLINEAGYGDLFKFFLRIPSIIACFVFAALVPLKFSQWNELKKKPTLTQHLLVIPLALSPALLYNVFIFGQVDSYFCAFTLFWLMAIQRKRVILASTLYGYLLITKPQSLFFLPFWVICLSFFFWRNRDFRLLGKCFAATFGVALVFLFPFWWARPGEAVTHYLTGLQSYSYATVNAFNFYVLIGKNWWPNTEPILWILRPVHFAALSLLIPLALLFTRYLYKKRNFSSTSNHELLLIGAILVSHVYFFFPKMHERYLVILYPFFVFLAFRSIGLYLSYILFALAVWGNQVMVMKHYGPGQIELKGAWLYVIAIGFLLSYLTLIWEWLVITVPGIYRRSKLRKN